MGSKIGASSKLRSDIVLSPEGVLNISETELDLPYADSLISTPRIQLVLVKGETKHPISMPGL